MSCVTPRCHNLEVLGKHFLPCKKSDLTKLGSINRCPCVISNGSHNYTTNRLWKPLRYDSNLLCNHWANRHINWMILNTQIRKSFWGRLSSLELWFPLRLQLYSFFLLHIDRINLHRLQIIMWILWMKLGLYSLT